MHCINQERCPSKYIIIGGKIMGARIASMVADEHKVAGVICLSYPFHPLKKPNRFRIKHLKTIQTPTLICQGERDPFGKQEEVLQQFLSKSIHYHWLADGDHNFKPRKMSGRTLDENMEALAACLADATHGAFASTLPGRTACHRRALAWQSGSCRLTIFPCCRPVLKWEANL